MSSDEPDPNAALVALLVDETIARYRHLLPPEALADLRAQLEGVGLTHPEMRKMIDRLRPRAVPDASATKPKEGEPTAELPVAAAGDRPRATSGRRSRASGGGKGR